MYEKDYRVRRLFRLLQNFLLKIKNRSNQRSLDILTYKLNIGCPIRTCKLGWGSRGVNNEGVENQHGGQETLFYHV